MRSTFDPTIYHFTPIQPLATESMSWETRPSDMGVIGVYTLNYFLDDDIWDLKEIYFTNNNEKEVSLYYGKIPDDNFGFHLFRNLNLELPIIRRNKNLDLIFKSDTD